MTEKHGFISKSISINQIPQFHTKIPQFLSERCVELRGFWCGTERGWNLGVFGIEPRGFGLELRGFRCGTEGLWGLKRTGTFVSNWFVKLRGCGTEADSLKISAKSNHLNSYSFFNWVCLIFIPMHVCQMLLIARIISGRKNDEIGSNTKFYNSNELVLA